MSKTKSDVTTRFTPFTRQCFVAAAVCINTVGHGCGLGYNAVLMPQLRAPDAALRVTDDAGSWIASVTGITLLLGNFLVLPVMERAGRRAALLAGGAPALLGWLCTALAADAPTLLAGSMLRGLSYGMALPLRSVMLGEYTAPARRGAFLATLTLSQAFGIFFVHLLGSLVSWQRTALVCGAFFFISHVMVTYIPESPSYLVARGRRERSRAAFRWLRGDADDAELDAMLAGQLAYEKSRNEGSGSVIRDATKKAFYLPVLLMAHAYVMSQLSGSTIMANYSTEMLGIVLPQADPNVWMVALDAQRLVTNTLAVCVMDRVARRTMLFATGALCVASHLAVAAYVLLRSCGWYTEPYWTPLVLLNLHVVSIAAGMVPLPNVIAGEVFPLRYRSAAGGLSLVASAAAMFVAVKTFPALVRTCGLAGTYALYAGVLTYCLAVLWRLLPETRGRTLLQIEQEFRGTAGEEDTAEGGKRRPSAVSCVL